MKRILSIILIMLLLLSAGITASAEDVSDRIPIPSYPCITDDVPVGAPAWKDLNNVSMTFYIMAGRADVSFTVSSSSPDIRIKIEIVKNGFFAGTVAEKEFVITDRKFVSGALTAPVDRDGKYTAIITVKSGKDKAEIHKEYNYSAGDFTGDVNYDGQIRADDARRILRYAAKIDRLSDDMKKVCDIDCNNYVNAADARIVLRRAARL